VDPSRLLDRGGEACIYTIAGRDDVVMKIYHEPNARQGRKLSAMIANPPDDPMAAHGHRSIAWPIDLVYAEPGNEVVGFIMPRVTGTRRLIDFYLPVNRRRICPLFSYRYLIHTARNFASALAAIHARGCVVGDISESNIMVSDTALVTMVDTDSFQVPGADGGGCFRCTVGRPEFTPPEIMGRSFRDFDRAPDHDVFGLAVLIFQLLMEGRHPFAGVYTGIGEPPTIAQRIRDGQFPYGRRPGPFTRDDTPPAFESLHSGLRELLLRCFDDGASDPSLRPTAAAWRDALDAAEEALISCARNPQHQYDGRLAHCPWCERTAMLGGRDPFPSVEAVGRAEHLAASPAVQTPLPPIQQPPVAQALLMPSVGTTSQKRSALQAAALIAAMSAPAVYRGRMPGESRLEAMRRAVNPAGATATVLLIVSIFVLPLRLLAACGALLVALAGVVRGRRFHRSWRVLSALIVPASCLLIAQQSPAQMGWALAYLPHVEPIVTTTEYADTPIHSSTRRIRVRSLAADEWRTVNIGSDGISRSYYSVTRQGGRILNRKLIKGPKTIRNPVPTILEYGVGAARIAEDASIELSPRPHRVRASVSSEWKRCSKCRRRIPRDALVCEYCGAPQ